VDHLKHSACPKLVREPQFQTTVLEIKDFIKRLLGYSTALYRFQKLFSAKWDGETFMCKYNFGKGQTWPI